MYSQSISDMQMPTTALFAATEQGSRSECCPENSGISWRGRGGEHEQRIVESLNRKEESSYLIRRKDESTNKEKRRRVRSLPTTTKFVVFAAIVLSSPQKTAVSAARTAPMAIPQEKEKGQQGRKMASTRTKYSFIPSKMEIAKKEEKIGLLRRKRVDLDTLVLDEVDNDNLFKGGMFEPGAHERDLGVYETRDWGVKVPPRKNSIEAMAHLLNGGSIFDDMSSMSFSMSMSTMMPTVAPSLSPTSPPTGLPSSPPTVSPTESPTDEPTFSPSESPTTSSAPSIRGSSAPTTSPAPSVSHVPSISLVPTTSQEPTISARPTISSAPTPINCTDPATREQFLMEVFVACSGEGPLNDPNSPQSEAADYIINTDPLSVNPCTFTDPSQFTALQQRYALVVFFFALGGDNWLINSGWLGGTSVCIDWFGLACNSDGLVSSILLSRNNLIGQIPPEIKALIGLELFQVIENGINGTVPTEFGLLQGLIGFDIESNEFEGEIFFDEIFNLNNIIFFRVSDNGFTGTVPWIDVVDSFPDVVQFWIAANRFEGSIGKQIGQLQSLESFFGYNNSLTGFIPSEIGNIDTLEFLDLENNLLEGTLPEVLYSITGLSLIILTNNSLTGTISTSVGNLDLLTDFWLSDNNFIGSIPSEVGRLSLLENLLLEKNQLTGPIPSEVGNLQSLNFTTLSNNLLTGAIPTSFFSLPNLEILYIENNTLSGNIPTEISNAPELRDLYLTGNILSGEIPEIPPGSLLTLEELLLSFNNLTGNMPSSICALRNDTMPSGSLISLHADCAIPPEPPEITCAVGCCTTCTGG
mmetsp:Transcript_341/g.455  ORF Transcript_341/g.455 Transcript_341/m.455 type:complete len:811 (-) Transcript_341:153-2585(-)